jgi:uncharacterized repeat protein (TIGR03943 family)
MVDAMSTWTPFLRRLMDSSALLVWGTVLCYFYFSERVASYLHPGFHVFTLVSGVVLLLLGVLTLVLVGLPECDCADPDCPEGSPRSLWQGGVMWSVVVVPVLVAASASPSQFGATAIMNRGLVETIDQLPAIGGVARVRTDTPVLPGGAPGTPWANDPSMDFSTYLARTEDGYIKAETIDLLFAAQEDPIRGDFEDQPIEIVGQFLSQRGERAADEKFQLVRIFIMCCAADGRPIGLTVEGTPPPDLPEMSWLKIRGVARFPVQGGRRVPVIEATSIEEVDPPRETFIY